MHGGSRVSRSRSSFTGANLGRSKDTSNSESSSIQGESLTKKGSVLKCKTSIHSRQMNRKGKQNIENPSKPYIKEDSKASVLGKLN